ncbi:MAG: hypothetical protein M3R13_05940 [Armatimonadota bacterium]|nr:hypothetical protein [Armatimonadota bacterium]
MKRFNAFLPATAMFVILAGCSGTSTSGGSVSTKEVPAEGVDFKLVAKKGDVYKYQIAMALDGKAPAGSPPPNEMKVKLDISQEVKVTDAADGNFTIEVKALDVKHSGTEPMASGMADGMKSTVGKMTVDPKGKVIKQEGSVDSAMGSGGTIFFPDKKIKPGDTWEKSMPGPSGNMLAKYKFVGLEDVEGKSLAKISMTPSTEGSTMSGNFDYWIDMDTGLIVKGAGKMTSASKETGSMAVTIDMKRQ